MQPRTDYIPTGQIITFNVRFEAAAKVRIADSAVTTSLSVPCPLSGAIRNHPFAAIKLSDRRVACPQRSGPALSN